MKRATLIAWLALAAAGALAAQETPPPLPSPPEAVEMRAPDGAILSFRSRGKTTVELVGTSRAASAGGEVDVEAETGYVKIEIGRGDIEGLNPAESWGADFLTYVVWVVPPDGAPQNIGELVFRDGRSEELKVATPYQTFWLLVTAEPDFAVAQPSPLAVLVSRSQDQTRTGNKALEVPGSLVYYTSYTDYDTRPGGQLSPGVPAELRQARYAVQIASRNPLLGGPALQRTMYVEQARARGLFEQARAYLSQAETEARPDDGDNRLMAQYARTATQLAEDARALVRGVAGGVTTRLLLAQIEELRSRLAETQQALTSLQDRSSQLEAALDQERRRTRDLESQLLALREQVDLLQNTLEDARQETAGMQAERSRLCEEMRRQLASLGQLTEDSNQLALTLSSDVLFEFNRYTLQPAARENLAKLATLRALQFPDAAIRYEGHTDLEGEEDYNQWLSEQRALAVYRFFLQDRLARTQIPDEHAQLDERLQVVEQLLGMNYNTSRRQADQRQELLARLGGTVVGKGMREPLVPAQGRNAQNRRVTLIFPQAGPGGLSSYCPSAAAVE
jgi:outer membrane protein OmpA-like peptidoglycan-associated protein